MANRPTVVFLMREYTSEHGRAPRGRGYWGFEFEDMEYWTQGTLTEAKKACIQHIREIAPQGYNDTVLVNVMP